MHRHNQTFTPKPAKRDWQDTLVTVTCLCTFAFWGVLLALGV